MIGLHFKSNFTGHLGWEPLNYTNEQVGFFFFIYIDSLFVVNLKKDTILSVFSLQ